MKTSYCVMKSIVLIAVSALCGCRSPSPLPVVTVTERVRSFPVKDSLSLTALIRVDSLKRIVLSEVHAAATPNIRYHLSLDTLPDASLLKLDVYNVRDAIVSDSSNGIRWCSCRCSRRKQVTLIIGFFSFLFQ